MIYLDSSALVKLALTGPESAELADWLAERDGQPLVSSVLHRAEVPRAVDGEIGTADALARTAAESLARALAPLRVDGPAPAATRLFGGPAALDAVRAVLAATSPSVPVRRPSRLVRIGR